jgi:predicted PurR-regulated permease PerM
MRPRPYAILIATLFSILLLLFIYSTAEVLLLVFISILISIYLSAITELLQRRLGIPRSVGTLSAIIVTLIAIAGIGLLIIPPLITQTQALLASLPDVVQNWNEQLRGLVQRSPLAATIFGGRQGEVAGENTNYLSQFIGEVGGYFRSAVPVVFGGVHFVIQLISVLVMGIYFTERPGLYREGVISLTPIRYRDLARDILTELGTTLRAWIAGQLFAMVVLGVLTWVGLELLRVPYALAFGVFAGLAAIVPFFGTLVSTLLPALFVIGGTGGLVHALLVVLLGVVIHLIEANFVAPMIMERQVSLPPVLSILSVLIMAHLLDVVGLLVAVPTLATVIVIVRRIYVHRILESRTHRRSVRDRPVELRLPGDESVVIHPSAWEESIPTILER